MTEFIEIPKAMRLAVACALLLVPGISFAGGRYDGSYITHLACEAHGETPAYKWEFPSEVTDNNFHGQHGEEGGPGYLVIDGKIADDGSAKLTAKGKVTNNHAHGVFAMHGDNYGYDIKAQFDDKMGTGKRDEGAGVLGRPCTFEFVKQDPNAKAADSSATASDSTAAPAADSTAKPADAAPKQQN
jgi:hypothetical protein